MLAIYKRELSSYFSSAIGYIYLSVFYLISGAFFYLFCLRSRSLDMRPVFAYLLTIFMILVPILTMRLMSEDKKLRTDQALLTAPISLFELVMGKFLSAFTVFVSGISVTLVYGLFLSLKVSPDWSIIIGCYFGCFLVGAAMISIGMFISQLTESQVISAIGTAAVIAFLMFSDTIANFININWIRQILYGISLNYNYINFATGLLNFQNVIYYLSVTALFIFLTIRVIDKKRWA